MSTLLIIANVVVLTSVIFHIFWGDNDIKMIEPDNSEHKKFENWIMARGAFHAVSVDMLMITAGLTLINFTDMLDSHRTILLKIMSVYCLLYAVFFFIVIAVSGSLPQKFLKLCQWALFLLLSGLIYFGI